MIALLLVYILAYLILTLLAAVALYAVSTWRTYLQFDMAKIPSPPSDFLTGHLKEMQQPNFHRILSSWTSQYGPVFRY